LASRASSKPPIVALHMIHKANSKPCAFNLLVAGSLCLVGVLALSGCKAQTFSSGFGSNSNGLGSTQQLNQLAQQAGKSLNVDLQRTQIDQLAAGIANKPSSLNSSPLRTPYPDVESTVANTAQNLKAKLDAARGNSIDQSLAAVTEKLQASGSATKPVAAPLPKKSANEFEAALAQTNSQLQTKLASAQSSGSATKSSGSATKSSGSNTKSSGSATKNSLAKVNNSLYDNRGNLTGGKKPIGSLDSARQRFSSAFGSVGDRAKVAANSATNFGGELKNKVAAAASTVTAPLSGGSFNPPIKAALDPAAAQGKALLDRAKSRVAGLGTGFDFPEPVSQPVTIPKFKAPAAISNQFGGGGFVAKPVKPAPAPAQFNQTRVANVTPVQSGFGQSGSGTSTGLASKLTNAWNNGGRQSQLKPVEVAKNLVPNPGNVLRTASLQKNDFGTGAAIPTFGNSRNVTASHVSDIYIPEKVLSGSGNYAPGSVNKVR